MKKQGPKKLLSPKLTNIAKRSKRVNSLYNFLGEKEMKMKRERRRNKDVEWRKELTRYAISVGKKLKITDRLMIIQAVDQSVDLAKSILQVYRITQDMGEMNENIKLLLQHYVNSKFLPLINF